MKKGMYLYFSSCFLFALLELCGLCPDFCPAYSDAGDITSPRREVATSPARVASPMHEPTPPRPEVTPTTPAPSLDKAVTIPDHAASSSRFATWEEHVSTLCFLELASLFLVYPLSYAFFPQPFGRALVEAGKTFFNMEQERSTFREVLESHAGKCFNLSTFTFRCAPSFLDLLLHFVASFCSRKGNPGSSC